MLKRNWRLLAAFGLIFFGVVLVGVFGMRAYGSFQRLRYIQEQGLDDGTADVSAIQPWMTARFVAVAYGVPEEFLFDRLGIEYDERDANAPLGRINRRLQPRRPPVSEDPEILKRVREIILEYRANPVTVELGRVEPWMSIRYIANSTGVPEADLLAALGLPASDEHANRPLGMLEREPDLKPNRMPELIRTLEEVLRAAGVGP